MTNMYEELLALLLTNEVKFIVVGGIAVVMNGFVRTTDDVDILVDDTAENIDLLLKTLKSFGEGHASELLREDFIDEEGAIRIIEQFPLDIFVRMQGLKYQDMTAMTAKYTMPYGLTVPYLHAKGLIELKKESWREKDQIDVIALKSILLKQKDSLETET